MNEATLRDAGIRIRTEGEFAWLDIEIDDELMYDKSYTITVKTTVVDEPEYYNTTVVDIKLFKPQCEVALSDINQTKSS